MSTASSIAESGLVAEARAYWRAYLWHHRDPNTRRLHRIGSWTCIAGAVAAIAGLGWYWIPIALVAGYGFAFAGHYLVEKNRPLTLKNPVRAAICNWVMFGYEFFWDVEDALRKIADDPPNTDDVGDQ